MDKKNVAMRVLFVFMLFSLTTAGLGAYGYQYMTRQKALITAKESEIAKLSKEQSELKSRLEQIEADKNKIAEENAQLNANAARYEDEKNIIMSQVRTTIGNFESFRADATNEIGRLKGTVERLESEKNLLIEEASQQTNATNEQKAALASKIEGLGKQIDDHKKIEQRLVRQIEKKENTAIAAETAKLHYNLGNFYYRHKDYKAAAQEYQTAIWYQPEDADSHFNLALVYDDHLAAYALAKDHYKKYLELRPDAKDYKKIRTRILEIDLRRAADIDKAVAVKPVTDKPVTNDFMLSNFKLEGDKK